MRKKRQGQTSKTTKDDATSRLPFTVKSSLVTGEKPISNEDITPSNYS